MSQNAIEILRNASDECGAKYVLGKCFKLSVISINDPPLEEEFQVVLCDPNDVSTLKNAYKKVLKEKPEFSATLGNAIQIVGVQNIK